MATKRKKMRETGQFIVNQNMFLGKLTAAHHRHAPNKKTNRKPRGLTKLANEEDFPCFPGQMARIQKNLMNLHEPLLTAMAPETI